MNTDGVVSLKEFLKSEIEGFDEMLVDTLIHGANMKHSKLKRRLHTEDQVQEHPNALTSASNKQTQTLQIIFQSHLVVDLKP